MSAHTQSGLLLLVATIFTAVSRLAVPIIAALFLTPVGVVAQPPSAASTKPAPVPNVDQLIRQGLISLQSNRFTEARASLEQATRLAPDNALAWTSLAEVYWRLHLKPKAISAGETAEKTGVGNPIVEHALALLYAEMEEFKRAAVLEEEFAHSSRAPADALIRAAGLYFNAGDNDAALRVAREAVARNSTPEANNILGKAAWAAGQRQEALDHLAAASQAEPGNGTYAFDYAQVLFRKGDFGTAADVLNTALAAHPNDPQLELALGVARYGQRRFDEAATAFLKTVSLDPSLPQPYDFLGKMLDQVSSRLPEITHDYDVRYKREPKNYQASFLLGKVRGLTGVDPAETEKLLRESISQKPDFWESHSELGQLLARRRQFTEAAVELNAAIHLSPDQPMPHYHLARVYDRLGESRKAKEQREIHERLTTAKETENVVK